MRGRRCVICALVALLVAIACAPGMARGARADETSPPPAPPLRQLADEPRLDGELGEWTGREPDFVIDRREQALPDRAERWKGPDDLSARGWWGLRGNTLWLALEIRDQQVFQDSAAPWWQGDAVELFLDPHRVEGEPAAPSYGPDCVQLFLLPHHPSLPWGVVWRGTTSHFDDAGLRRLEVRYGRPAQDRTTVELAWDLADLGIVPGPERVFGFALALDDADDGPGSPGTYLSWNGQFDLYRLPARFSEAHLPARKVQAPRPPAAPDGPSTLGLLALVLGAIAFTVLLVGPGGRALERVPTRALVVVLVVLAVAGVALGGLATGSEEAARESLAEALATEAHAATPLVAAARDVGALHEESPEARAASLAALLRGEPVPAAPGVEAAAYVPLRADGRFAAAPSDGYDLDLEAPLDLLLPEPLAASTLGLDVYLARPRRHASPLGTLALSSSSGEAASVEIVAPGGPTATVRINAALPEAPASGWNRLAWTPGPASTRARLRRLLAADSGSGERVMRLPGLTDEGVPVLAHPRQDAPQVRIAPGGRLDLELPVLLGGADRLWFVFGPEDDNDAAEDGTVRVEVRYAEGPPDLHELTEGVHLGPARRAEGMPRPPARRSRVAFDWTASDGFRHERDALPLRLDPQRRPEHVTIENRRGTRPLVLLAGTLVRTRGVTEGSPLRVVRDEDAAADRAVLATGDAFAALAARLPRPSTAGEDEALRVAHEAQVGLPGVPVPLRLEGRLDAEAAAGARRLGIARLAVLGLGVLVLLLLATRWARRLPTLGGRLTVGVLVAALVPLLVTLFLLESKQRRRLETEAQRELDETARSVQARLGTLVRETDDLARRLARHIRGLAETTPPERWPAAIRAVVPRGLAGSALVRSRTTPALGVTLGGTPLTALRALDEVDGESRLVASPWDGPLVVARGQAGRSEAIEVVIGRRLRDADLAALLVEDARGAGVALVADSGRRLAAAGDAGSYAADRFARARADAPRGPLAGRRGDALLSAVEVAPERGEGDGPLWVVAARPAAALDAAIASERVPLLWLALLGFALIASSAVLVARPTAAPVAALAAASEAMRRGEFDIPVPTGGADEVGRLARAFDQMRLDLSERMEDLGALRRAQDHLAEHLDHDVCAERVLGLLHETTGADVTCLLEARSGVPALALLGRRLRAEGPDETDAGEGRTVPLEDAFLRSLPAGPDGLVELPREASDKALEALGAGAVRWRGQALTSGGRVEAWALHGWRDRAAGPGDAARRRLPALGAMAAAALHRAHLYRVALLDEVTRVPGATAFEARLRRDVDAAVRGGPEVVLLRIGLDHIERQQREHGVEAARRLLQAIAAALVAEIGDVRRVGRTAPAELAARVAARTPGAVRALADRVRQRLASLHVPAPDGSQLTTTVSIGVALCPGDARSVEFLTGAAGTALAVAQSAGGDRVEEAAMQGQGAVDVPPFEEGAVFRSQAMVAVVEAARRAARSDASVLITGETGTGKEVLATLLHRRSARASRPLVSVNCAAFPDTLLESELFGHERGAFTGADRRREGRFEVADGGTLFLDEVGEMSPGAQAKLLRVLQEKQITRLGGTRPIPVDVRILAATNQDLERAVESGRFREDLYYRLNVIRLVVPPLRERREEIPLLVDLFLEEMRRRTGGGPRRLSPAAMDLLYRHPWPGNVRELRNTIERGAVLCDAEEIGPEHIQLDPGGAEARGDLVPRRAPGDDLNRRQQALLAWLARHGRCTSREYCELTGTSTRTALRDLTDLIDRGLLVREGKRRGAVYHLA
ncbi:MAG: sigma 54-interacting transcriptional regulator [Planctomycetes bacterium]|nr:sigma 54-interacting transcriptional regulator [Planctomycetota bacterium]